MGKHLTAEQRCELAALHEVGLTQAAIALRIGVSQSAVFRELQRNGGASFYCCGRAQDAATRRRSAASSFARKMTPAVVKLIEAKLRRQEGSPQQISSWLAQTQQICISHERIYQHIWADKRAAARCSGSCGAPASATTSAAARSPGTASSLAASTSIKDRPSWTSVCASATGRSTPSSAPASKAPFSAWWTASRATLCCTSCTPPRPNPQAAPSSPNCAAIAHACTPSPPTTAREFALHARVARRLAAHFYFAKPYHAWERGLNENTNGLVRQYFPKGTSFTTITPAAVLRVQNKLNSRPRKVLGYKTPNEVLFAP